MAFHPGKTGGMNQPEPTFTVFSGTVRIAGGPLSHVLPVLKRRFDHDSGQILLVFDDESGRQVDFDLRGSLDEVIARELPSPSRGPGRPKLGVVSREVSLLPRHWEWLEQQPNGISAALRRVVDQARKSEPAKERAKRMRAALSRFLTSMAGDLPRYEDASRALFAGEQQQLEALVERWPKGVREHVVERSRAAALVERGERG